MGLQLNPENRWIKKAKTIPWDAVEERYAVFFPSNRGVAAKPLRMTFGSLILQKHIGCSDRELLEQNTETPYFQVDKIYRNRKNLSYCKLRGLRLSESALDRPKKNVMADKKIEYEDAVDRLTRLSFMRFLPLFFKGTYIALSLEVTF